MILGSFPEMGHVQIQNLLSYLLELLASLRVLLCIAFAMQLNMLISNSQVRSLIFIGVSNDLHIQYL